MKSRGILDPIGTIRWRGRSLCCLKVHVHSICPAFFLQALQLLDSDGAFLKIKCYFGYGGNLAFCKGDVDLSPVMSLWKLSVLGIKDQYAHLSLKQATYLAPSRGFG